MPSSACTRLRTVTHVSAQRIARLPDAERVRFEGKSLGQIATKAGIPRTSLHRYLGTAETGA